jgi:methylglyoxal synthase
LVPVLPEEKQKLLVLKRKECFQEPLGGDAQIAGRVAEGITQMVFFFKDPLSSHPHEADINMLIRVCDVHNVPLATNEATAQLLLDAIALQL